MTPDQKRATDSIGHPLRCCDEHEAYDPDCARGSAQEQVTELPLPRENFDGMTVVASAQLDDDSVLVPAAVVLLVASSEPFYRVREITFSNGEWRTGYFEDFPNIVLAVEYYRQEVGTDGT